MSERKRKVKESPTFRTEHYAPENPDVIRNERDALLKRVAELEDALDSACRAGLALGEHCKLNPTAYVNDIKRAQGKGKS